MRRSKIAGGLCLVFSLLYCATSLFPTEERYGGWLGHAMLLESEPVPGIPTSWSGSGKGETRLLYRDYREVHGFSYVPRDQGNSPSCVGHAAAAAVDFLAAVEIHFGNRERAPPGGASASAIYGLSRVEIGGLAPGSGGGSLNIWAVRALNEYGAVAQLNYRLLGYDLRTYQPARADYFGEVGLPTSLERVSYAHPILDYLKIKSYEECRAALAQGSPVIVGSNQGFGAGKLVRDKDGFLTPPKGRRRKPAAGSRWLHSMVVIAVADEGRKGVLILNSWGPNWVEGPLRFGDEPKGSFWCDWKVIDGMLLQGDSYALYNFQGWPIRSLMDIR